MNSSRAMPIWAIKSMLPWLAMTPSPAGPARIPAAMNMMISGCRSFWPRAPSSAARARMAAISTNVLGSCMASSQRGGLRPADLDVP